MQASRSGDPWLSTSVCGNWVARIGRFASNLQVITLGGKQRAQQLAEELRAGRHRALVFSRFVELLQLLRQELDQRGWSYLYLDGSTPASQRPKLVNELQEGETDFFLISPKAGGTGLNLTAADYVVHLDPWWNPAAEDQA